jgi:hypothetical protein
MVQEHATETAEKLGKSEFKVSIGWLESFRKKYQIIYEVRGEAEDVYR